MSQPIEVFRHGKDTRIEVSERPDPRAPWRVNSADRRGRELEITGYNNFDQRVVGRLTLHVDDKKPLLITKYRFEDHLLVSERPDVLGQLVLCARSIATKLHEKLHVGNGCLMWQLDNARLDAIRPYFPDFEPISKRRPLKRGQRYLLWRS